MTDEDVLQTLRELAQRLGKRELTVEDVEEHLPFSGETLRRRWGTSRAAFEAAGFVDSDLSGHAFRYEAGHLYRYEAGRRSDLKSATSAMLTQV